METRHAGKQNDSEELQARALRSVARLRERLRRGAIPRQARAAYRADAACQWARHCGTDPRRSNKPGVGPADHC